MSLKYLTGFTVIQPVSQLFNIHNPLD